MTVDEHTRTLVAVVALLRKAAASAADFPQLPAHIALTDLAEAIELLVVREGQFEWTE